MSKLYVLNAKGDQCVTWTPEQVEAGDHEALTAIAAAEAIFARERSRGSSAFKLAPGEPAERIDIFDRAAREIVIIPRMAGG